MSKISELRGVEKYKIKFISILELFISDAKYIAMFQKLLKDFIQEQYDMNETKIQLLRLFPEADHKHLNSLTDLELLFALNFFFDIMPTEITTDFKLFCDYNEKKLVKNNDLQSYTSFNEVRKEIVEIKEKEKAKLLEKQTIKILDNDEWLIIKPLSYEASLKYGATTKWCTAAKEDKQYFNQYTKNGILIYFIDKINNRKYAIHRKIKGNDITYWDAEDKPTDLFDFNLSPEAYKVVIPHIRTDKTNLALYTDLVEDNKPKVPQKKFAGYTSENELIDAVQRQYEENERWQHYIEQRNNRDLIF